METEPEFLRVTLRDRYLFVSKNNMTLPSRKAKKKRLLGAKQDLDQSKQIQDYDNWSEEEYIYLEREIPPQI